MAVLPEIAAPERKVRFHLAAIDRLRCLVKPGVSLSANGHYSSQ